VSPTQEVEFKILNSLVVCPLVERPNRTTAKSNIVFFKKELKPVSKLFGVRYV
jgi:hypothetical protein